MKIICPNCRKTLNFQATSTGKRGRCPECNHEINVPAQARATGSSPVVTPVNSRAQSPEGTLNRISPIINWAAVVISMLALLFSLVSLLRESAAPSVALQDFTKPDIEKRLEEMTLIITEQEKELDATNEFKEVVDAQVTQLLKRLDSIELTIATNLPSESSVQTADFTSLRTDFESFRESFQYMMKYGLIASSRKTAVLDPSNPNYACVDIEQGKLLLSCQDAEPYLDGVKLRLDIGNPMAVDFTGYDIFIRWGKRFEGTFDNIPAFAKWRQSLHEKKYTRTDVLKLAAWNECTIILPNTKPSEVGYLEAQIDVNTVSLSRNYPK